MNDIQLIPCLIRLTKEYHLVWHSPELYKHITKYKDIFIIAEDDYTGGGLQNTRKISIKFIYDDNNNKTWEYDGVEVIKLLHAISDQLVVFTKCLEDNKYRRNND